MNPFGITCCILVSSFTLAMGGGGSFDKKNEDSYQQIVIGAVRDVRVVSLIANRPASMEEVRKSAGDQDDTDYHHGTLLYTGVLKVEKTIKGELQPGEEVIVVWSQAGHSDENGIMYIKSNCPHVSESVAKGRRLVFGFTGKSGTAQAWHIVDGPTSLYEPAALDVDPFADDPPVKDPTKTSTEQDVQATKPVTPKP